MRGGTGWNSFSAWTRTFKRDLSAIRRRCSDALSAAKQSWRRGFEARTRTRGPPPHGIWIASIVRAPSNPFRLDPDGFGLDLAGLGVRPAGKSVRGQRAE